MIHREETFENPTGVGRMEFRRHGGADGLFADGEPIALRWPDCSGSCGQEFFVMPGISRNESEKALREIVRDGRNLSGSLDELFAPLLSQLTPGRYRLALEEIEGEWTVLYPYHGPGTVSCYYPLGTNYDLMRNLVATQPEESLSEKRIEEWKALIQSGERPFALVLGDLEFDAFVLDGHHKLLAYARLGVAPWLLTIEPIVPGTPLAATDWPHELVAEPTYGWQYCFRGMRERS